MSEKTAKAAEALAYTAEELPKGQPVDQGQFAGAARDAWKRGAQPAYPNANESLEGMTGRLEKNGSVPKFSIEGIPEGQFERARPALPFKGSKGIPFANPSEHGNKIDDAELGVNSEELDKNAKSKDFDKAAGPESLELSEGMESREGHMMRDVEALNQKVEKLEQIASMLLQMLQGDSAKNSEGVLHGLPVAPGISKQAPGGEGWSRSYPNKLESKPARRVDESAESKEADRE